MSIDYLDHDLSDVCKLDGNPAERRAIWSREDSRFLDTFMVSTLFFNLLHCGMLNL